MALLRVGTHPKLKIAPLANVLGFWQDLRTFPGARMLTAGKRHAEYFAKESRRLRLTGNELNDAWLAALAVEYGAVFVTADQGFTRFFRLKTMNPIG